MRPSPPPSAISSVDLEVGIITLSDGSGWQIGPGDLPTVSRWRPGRPAELRAEGPTREVVYSDDGSAALVCPAPPRAPSRLLSPRGPAGGS